MKIGDQVQVKGDDTGQWYRVQRLEHWPRLVAVISGPTIGSAKVPVDQLQLVNVTHR